MVRGHGGRVWLWLVVVGIALRSVVEAQEYLNQSFPVQANANLSSYEQTIQEEAYAAFARENPDTGTLWNTTLNNSLANITVQAVRLRVGSLWRYGVTLGRFTIPPGLRITNASSLRVILVYRDFGNVSVYSASVPGQVLVSSLSGIRLYNGDTLNSTTPLPALTAIALLNPIEVIIPPNRQPSYCVEFLNNGTALATMASMVVTNTSATNSSAGNVSSSSPTYACVSRTLGENYFALTELAPPGKKSNTWKIVLGTVLGVVLLVLILLCLVFGCRRQMRNRRVRKMQEHEEKGVTLHPEQVANTRVPVATQSRTKPELEELNPS